MNFDLFQILNDLMNQSLYKSCNVFENVLQNYSNKRNSNRILNLKLQNQKLNIQLGTFR